MSEDPRLIPGGVHPAKTPGGTGPATRDSEHAVRPDANDQLIGRAEQSKYLKARAKPEMPRWP